MFLSNSGIFIIINCNKTSKNVENKSYLEIINNKIENCNSVIDNDHKYKVELNEKQSK